MKRIYLDYASTTPVDKRVFEKMKPYFQKDFANPSSLYEEGVKARRAVETARKEIADILHALPQQITFTASGTESNNLAILGTFYFFKEVQKIKKPHFVTSTIEHPSILEVFRAIEKKGGEVTYVSPLSDGTLDPGEIKKHIKETTVLVSILYANNEIGTINPIKEISKEIRRYKKHHKLSSFPYFHTDASQASNYLDVNVLSLNVDMMTLDASKMYGPKGIGLLYKRSTINIQPLLFGGNQEKGLRPGTENVASIVGCSESLKIAQAMRREESERIRKIRDRAFFTLLDREDCTVNGSLENRLPNNINVCMQGVDAEYLVFLLDAQGYCVSSVTSCRNLSEESSSYVVEALGKSDCGASSLRITLGRPTKQSEVDGLLKILPGLIDKARKN